PRGRQPGRARRLTSTRAEAMLGRRRGRDVRSPPADRRILHASNRRRGGLCRRPQRVACERGRYRADRQVLPQEARRHDPGERQGNGERARAFHADQGSEGRRAGDRRGAGGGKVPFVASADERYVVFGTVEDVTTDPAKAVMEKINLKGEPFKGPADAKVTIVEYSDFQCPFCGRGYQTMENQVLKDYGDKVRFYCKNYPLPFHPWAEPAAVA